MLEIKTGFGGVNKKIDNALDLIDKLAVSTLNGFEKTATKDDIEELKDQIQGVNKRIDNFAETKVSKIVYKELENRVQKIEAKI
mgnify:CR=1 FL=1